MLVPRRSWPSSTSAPSASASRTRPSTSRRSPGCGDGRDQGGPGAIRRGQGRHPDRHPPAALEGRPRQGPRPADRGRGAALRRQAEGAAPPAEAQGGCPLAVGDADPCAPCRCRSQALRDISDDRDAARGTAARPNPRRPLRRGPGEAGDHPGEGALRAGLLPPQPDRLLHETAERLRALCPGVRFARRTARWTSWSWRPTMLAFVRGEHDCLVATTIIESASTSLMRHAPGGAGRPARTGAGTRSGAGWPEPRARLRLPADPSAESLTPDAAARLSTLSDNTELGSGFRVAMRDLEIRGAGNLLGDEQSGHVAAVGFELYCQMLEDAAEELRAGITELPAEPREPVRIDVDVDAYVPADYIPFEAAKIDVHRRVRRPGSPVSFAPCGRSSRTASAPFPSRSPTCSTSSGSASRSGTLVFETSSSAPGAFASPRSSSIPSRSARSTSASRRRSMRGASARSRCRFQRRRVPASAPCSRSSRGSAPRPRPQGPSRYESHPGCGPGARS